MFMYMYTHSFMYPSLLRHLVNCHELSELNKKLALEAGLIPQTRSECVYL